MSKYTMQLRYAVLDAVEHHNIPVSDAWETDLEQYWHYAYKYIGLEDYPIFDEAYREELNAQIIRHYYFEEIGCETLAQFAFRMRAHMWEVMPYFNKLYLAAMQLDEKDLWSSGEGSWRETVDHDERTAHDETVDHDEAYTQDDSTSASDTRTTSSGTTASGTTGGTSSDQTKTDVLDLPMGTLGSSNDLFASGEYATNRERVVSNGSTTGTSSSQTTSNETVSDVETGTLDRDGTRDFDEQRNYEGTRDFDEDRRRTYDERKEPFAVLFARYRDALVDIDALVVESCSSYFMGMF